MCNECKNCHHGSSNSFLTGAVLGAIAGAALGLYFSPGTGEQNRKKFNEAKEKYQVKGLEAYEEVSQVYSDVKTAADPLIKEVEEKLGPIIQDAKKAGKPVSDQVKEKIRQLTDDYIDSAKKTS